MKIVKDLWGNLRAGARLALFLPLRREAFRGGFGAIAPLVAVTALGLIGLDFTLTEAPRSLYEYGVAQFLAVNLVLLAVGLALEGRAAGPWGRSGFLVPFMAALPLIWIAYLIWHLIAQWGHPELTWPVEWAFALWFFFVAVRALRIGCGFGLARAKAFAVPLVAGLAAVSWLLPFWGFWYHNPVAEASSQNRPRISIESTYYAQAGLVRRALAGLAEQRPGVVDLYFVGFGSHGAQDVFMKEVQAAQAIFEQRFDAANRSLAMINNSQTLKALPLANLHNLRRVLAGLAKVMDTQEDLLFLFLTSHGAPDHWLSVRYGRLGLNHLTNHQLAEVLAESGIQTRVVLVSACYSGGFVEPLSGPNVMVMTAAASDRTSFGCSNTRDWTYFGQAYFAEALQSESSFLAAFYSASAIVSGWEERDGLTPSEPQISVGADILPVLTAFEERLKRQQPAMNARAGSDQ
jgi:hypothetical protein